MQENWRKFNQCLIIRVSLLWQQSKIKAPVVLVANVVDFCTEFRPELWFIGSLHANCTKAAQAAERARHWTWPELLMVISNHQANKLFMKTRQYGSGGLEGKTNCLHLPILTTFRQL